MDTTPESPLAGWKQAAQRLTRVNGGVLTALVIVGFFVVMVVALPEWWLAWATLLGAGALIAFWLERGEAQGFPTGAWTPLGDVEADGQSKLFGPNALIEVKPWITGHPVGLVMSIGFALIIFAGVPETRIFILGALAAGGIVGLILWWRHR